MRKHKYTVDIILPKTGDSVSVEEYIAKAEEIYKDEMYPHQKALGSIGGAKSCGVVFIENGYITRV